MIGFVSISISLFLLFDYYKIHKRKQFLKETGEPVYKHRRQWRRFKLSDVFVLIVIATYAKKLIRYHDFTYLALIVLFVFVTLRDRVRFKSDIVLYAEGMLYDMTYVLWRDVRDVKAYNHKSLRVAVYGKYDWKDNVFVIDNIEQVDELEKQILNIVDLSYVRAME